MSGGRKQKWYFDACVLDKKKGGVIEDIINNAKHRQNCVSHLAIGEAYGSCLCKGGGNREEKARAFIELIDAIKNCISIISNDINKAFFDEVKKSCPKLKVADAIHLATAIDAKCDIFCTSDHDIYQYDNKDVKELSQKCTGYDLKFKRIKYTNNCFKY